MSFLGGKGLSEEGGGSLLCKQGYRSQAFEYCARDR